MAFWEEPPIYMTERERRLRFQDPVFPKLEDESIHSNTIIEEKEVKEDSDDERSNFKMKSKEKLHELARYVIDHMFRSMRSKWPKIKEIFLPKGRSNLRRETSSRLGRNSSPPPPLLRQPSITASASNNRNKTPTSAPKARKEVRVPLSAVFASLVSTDLAIPLSDALKVIWGLRLPETDVQLSCRIFIQSIENELFDHIDMNLISQTDEVLVSETQLMNAMFSDDPVLREKELSVAQDDYRMVAAAILEKNRKVYSIEEKGKIRGLKNITLFDTALFEQQPSKGPLHGRRLDVIFRLVIATRKQLHFERIRRANQILATYRTLLELIDRDYFSDTFLAFVKDPPFNAPPTFDGENNAGIPPSSVFHILHLAGSPTLVEGCRTLILAGQGLNGMALSNVAEILQALAASKIQNYFRTHRRKWRYFTARGKWRIVFLAVKKSHVKAWFMYTQQMIRYRTHCLRKIVAWHFYTKKNKTRRYFFQHSYWPFYVWHRYSSASRIAKEKCKFLVTRVYPTYVQLKFFRAWKKVIIERLSWHLKSDLHYRSTLKQKMFQAFGWLRRQSRMKVALRNSDLKKRLRDVTSQILTRKISYFQIWRAYSSLRKSVQGRVRQLVPIFRSAIMGDKSLHNSYEKNRAMHMEIARGKIFEREKVAEKIRRREMRRRLLTGDVSEGDITVGSSLRSVSLFAESLNDDDSSLLAASDGSSSDDDELIEINRGTKPKEPMETSPWMDRRPRPNFQWSLYHADGFYDIDVDGEFAEEVPPHLLKVYLQKMEPLERAVDPHILAWASHDVLSAVSNLVSNFSTVEFWHLLEDSMVFHRAGSRAFRNLQLFSLFRRRGRKANNAYKLRLLRLTFEALYQWMHRVAGEGDEKSDAEGIALQARAIRLANLDRRRELQKRMLQIKEDGSGTNAAASAAVDVDLLEFDRDERWEEMKQLKSMIALSNGYETYAYKLVEKNSGENPERELTAAKLGLIPRILERESRVTKKAAEKEYQYALDFKLHAAYTLVTVLSRVYVVASYSTTFGLAKACFKVFRMPVLKKKSVYLRNRAIMKNYIRICKRQTSLSQNIHIYYRLRTMWAAYNRWLKLIELSYLDTSPGLLLYLKRAASMFLDYDRTLKSHGFKVQEYPRSSPLLGFSLEVPQLFHRWKMFAQESKLFKLLDKRAAVIYNCRLLKKVFHIIRYRSRDSLSSSSSSHFSDIESPVYIRCLNDFDQMMKRFVCIRRLTIYRKILLLNRQYRAAIMHSGRKILTFKGFIRRLHDDVNERISTELGVLSEAFENRGAIGFIDITDTLKVPDLMLRLHGTHFSDPLVSPPNETASLPGGYLLSSVHICLQEMSGIVGWQLVWRADCAPDITGARRGKWAGAASTYNEILLPANDFLRGVEYFYEGTVIYGVRFQMYSSGWSRWVGGRNSMSTMTCYIDALSTTSPEDKEEVYDFADEPDTFYKKRYIIGLTGLETSLQCTGMGVVVRNVTRQNVFSYHWVNEGIVKEAARLEQKKKLEKLRMDRTRMMNRRLNGRSNKISLPDIINSQIIAKMNKAGKWTKGVAETIKEVASKYYSNSLEQYLDVNRMRSKEIQGALQRAEDFAIRLWAGREVAHSPLLAPLASLKIIAGLTRWFFEAVSKRLMKVFPRAKEGTQMILDSMLIHNAADADLRESASINLAAYRLEIDKTRRPWEKKYLLSPEDRKLKRTYEKEVDAIKESAAAVIKSADLKDSQAFELYKKGNKLLPFIELNNFISTNYKQKVDAARHKAVLLERMTIHEFKTSLHGAALDGAQTGLSAESMTAIANLMVLKKKEAVYVPFLEDAQRQIELEMEKIRLAAEESRRQEQALRGTFRKSQYIPNPVDISRRPVRPRPVRTLPKLQSSSMQKKSIMSASLTSLPRRQQVTSQGSASTGFSEPSEDCIQVAKQIHSPNMTDDDVVSLSD